MGHTKATFGTAHARVTQSKAHSYIKTKSSNKKTIIHSKQKQHRSHLTNLPKQGHHKIQKLNAQTSSYTVGVNSCPLPILLTGRDNACMPCHLESCSPRIVLTGRDIACMPCFFESSRVHSEEYLSEKTTRAFLANSSRVVSTSHTTYGKDNACMPCYLESSRGHTEEYLREVMTRACFSSLSQAVFELKSAKTKRLCVHSLLSWAFTCEFVLVWTIVEDLFNVSTS